MVFSFYPFFLTKKKKNSVFLCIGFIQRIHHPWPSLWSRGGISCSCFFSPRPWQSLRSPRMDEHDAHEWCGGWYAPTRISWPAIVQKKTADLEAFDHLIFCIFLYRESTHKTNRLRQVVHGGTGQTPCAAGVGFTRKISSADCSYTSRSVLSTY